MPSRSTQSASTRLISFRPGELWAFGSSVSYAASAIFSRVASVAIHPFIAPALRLLPLIGLSWVKFFRSRNKIKQQNSASKTVLSFRVFLVIILGGTLTTVVGTVGYFYALRIGGVVLTQPVLATNILWSAVIAAIFLHEKLNRKIVAGLVVAMVGVALLGYGQAISKGTDNASLIAIPLALIPAVSWAGGANCYRYALINGVDKYTTLAVGSTSAILVLFITVLITGQSNLFTTIDLKGAAIVLIAGIFTGLAQITLTQALSLTSVASTMTIIGINPVLAAIFATLFLGEQLTTIMIVGTILTVIGVVLAQIKANVISEIDI